MTGIPRAAVLVLCFFLSPTYSIDRDKCTARFRNRLFHPNGTRNLTYKYDNGTFHIADDGQELTPQDPFAVHLDVCREECREPREPWYPESGFAERVTVWLVPILLLAGNMHHAPLANRYSLFTLFHLMADPVDSILSQLHVLVGRGRGALKRQAAEVVASMDLAVSPEDLAELAAGLDVLHAQSSVSPLDLLAPLLNHPGFCEAVAVAAADFRTTIVHGYIRTGLALITFLVSVTGAFAHATSDEASGAKLPGNRIAFAMLYSWLIPAILLSAAGKRFCAEDSCRRAVRRFMDSLGVPEWVILPDSRPSMLLRKSSVIWETGDQAAPWNGAICAFRPSKRLVRTGWPSHRSPLYLLALALLPVLFSGTIGIVISYHTPTQGVNCRVLTHISITIAWLISFCITVGLHETKLATGRYHLRIVAVKDVLVGLSVVVIVLLIFAGLYNSCWCWSNGFVHGGPRYVILGHEILLKKNAGQLYPGLVAGGVGLQLLIFIIMWVDGWSDYVRWSSPVPVDRRPKCASS